MADRLIICPFNEVVNDLTTGLFSVRLVGKGNDTRTERLYLYKFQGRIAPISKETLPFPQNNRIEQEIIFIDEVMLNERLHKSATTKEQDVLTGLLL